MIRCAHAVLLLKGDYVLQLRDDKPGIAARGMWSYFGGRVRPGESAARAVRREVREELGIEPRNFRFLWRQRAYGEFERRTVSLALYEARVDGCWGGHRLTEGQRVGTFSYRRAVRLDMPDVMRRVLDRHHQMRARAARSER